MTRDLEDPDNVGWIEAERTGRYRDRGVGYVAVIDGVRRPNRVSNNGLVIYSAEPGYHVIGFATSTRRQPDSLIRLRVERGQRVRVTVIASPLSFLGRQPIVGTVNNGRPAGPS